MNFPHTVWPPAASVSEPFRQAQGPEPVVGLKALSVSMGSVRSVNPVLAVIVVKNAGKM